MNDAVMMPIHIVPIGEGHKLSRDCPCDPWVDDALRIIRHRRKDKKAPSVGAPGAE